MVKILNIINHLYTIHSIHFITPTPTTTNFLYSRISELQSNNPTGPHQEFKEFTI